MKLHLPTGLRKALLACLAAVAGRRALRRTVASGTALLGVFSLLWSTTTPAQADEEPPLAAPSGDELALGTESEDEKEQAPLAANSEEDIMLLAATEGVMPLATGDALTWSGTAGTITLGASTSASSANDGWETSEATLVEGRDVILLGQPGDGDTNTVTVDGQGNGVSMGSLSVGAPSNDTTKYVFKAGSTEQTLTITGALTFRAGDVTFGSAEGNALSLSAGRIVISSGNVTFQGAGTFDVTGTLTLGSGAGVVIGEDSILTVGGFAENSGGAYGTITGQGTLKLTAASGLYAGSIGSDFEFEGTASNSTYTLTGSFSGSHLAVSQGKLQLKIAGNDGLEVNLGGAILNVSAGSLEFLNAEGVEGTLTNGGTRYIVGGLAGRGTGLIGAPSGVFTTLVIDYSGSEKLKAEVNLIGTDGTYFMSLEKKGTGTQEIAGITEGTKLFHVFSLAVTGGTLETTVETLETCGVVKVGNDDGNEAHLIAKNWTASNYNGAGSAITVGRGGTIELSGNLTSSVAIAVNQGGTVKVTGKLGIVDNDTEAVLTIAGGGSVTAGSLGGTTNGHAGRLKVGGAETSGTLTVGTQSESHSYSGDAFMAKSLYVQNSADDAGEGSVVTIYGNVNFYNYVSGQESYAMIIDGKSKVTIDGTLHGHSDNLRSVKLDNGGELSVNGAVTIASNYGLDVVNGSATLSGGVTASFITMSQGSLTLGGALNVANGVNASGGTLKLGTTVNVVESLAISLSGGAVLEMKEGSPTISENKTLTLTIDAASTTEGGKLRLTDTVMNALLDLKDQIDFSITGAHIGANWEYQLFDLTGLSGTWSNGVAESFLKELLSPDEGASLTVDEYGMVRYALYAESRDLTWTGGDASDVWDTAATNWQEGGQTGQIFGEHDSVTFDDTATTKDVTVSGNLTPGDIRVTSKSAYTFTGQDSASITASGNLYVNDGSSATFSNLASFSVAGGEITGSLTLESTVTGTKSLGHMTVGEDGVVTITDGTANNWVNTTLSGDGTVVLNAGGTVTVNGENNLFAALFAEGDTNLQRDETHGGIGQFEVASGSTLILAANATNIGKGMSFLRELKIASGATLKTTVQQVFDYQGKYTQHGKLILDGHGNGENTGALHVTAQDWMKWDVELANDATIYVENVTLHFGGSGDYAGSFNGQNHKLVVRGSGSAVLKIDEGFAMNGSGIIEMNEGTQLQISPTSGSIGMNGYGIILAGGSLQLMKSMTVKSLSGNGGVSYGGGHVLTIVGTSEGEYTGTITNAASSRVTVNGGASFLLGNGASVGNTLEVSGTLSTKAGTYDSPVGATVNVLNVGDGGQVSLGDYSTLTVTTLGGVGGQYGSITGGGTLKLNGNGGSFGGAISSNFEYEGSGTTAFSYTGAFSGGTLTVTNGSLTLGSGFSCGITSDITVSTGGTLTLDYENGQTGGLLTMNGGTLNVGTTATDGYTFAGLSGSDGSFSDSGKLVLDVDSGEQTFGGVISNQSMGMVKKGSDAQKFTTDSQTTLKSLDLQAGELSFVGGLYVGANGIDLNETGLTVTGGSLQAGLLTVSRNISVSGAGTEVHVNGNANLSNYAKLTVTDGANVTIEGYLHGNKKGTAAPNVGEVCGSGQITVGEHDETSSSVGTLTLGKSGVDNVTHRASGVTVIGTSGGGKSTLTVYGNLSVYGYTGSNGESLNDGMQIGWGAEGTISGALTVGVGFESGIAIGGAEEGNTGTLTVGGLLTGHHLALAGNGSKLTANGGLTVADAVNVTGGTLELGGTVSAGLLTVTNGTVKALSGMTATRGQTWDFGAGGVLEVGDSGMLLSEGAAEWTLNIQVSGSADAWQGGKLKLTQQGLTALSELSGLKLTLTGLEEQGGTWTYQLFDMTDLSGVEGIETTLKDFLVKALGGTYSSRGLSVDAKGNVTYNANSKYDLTWNSNVGTWKDGGDAQWTVDSSSTGTFSNGDSVTFADSGEHSVAIEGTVSPASMKVTGGTWTFTGEDDSVLQLTGGLTLAESSGESNPTVTFQNASVTLEGTAEDDGETKATLTGAGTVNIGGENSSTSLSWSDILEVGDGATATALSIASGASMSGATLDVEAQSSVTWDAGATVNLTNLTVSGGSVTSNGALTLTNLTVSGGSVISNGALTLSSLTMESGDLTVTGGLSLSGAASTTAFMSGGGAVQLDTLIVSDAETRIVGGTVNVTGALTGTNAGYGVAVSGDFTVSGHETSLTITSGLRVNNNKTLTISDGAQVTIGKLGGNYPQGGNGTKAGDVTIESGASLTVKGSMGSNATVTITGTGGDNVSQLILGDLGAEDPVSPVESSIVTLHVGQYGEVKLASEQTLIVTNLDGVGEETKTYGSISGDGTLKYTGNGGSFGGAIGTNFEYAGGSETFTYSGEFTGAELKVSSGSLTFGSAATLSEETNITLTGTGALTLDMTSASVGAVVVEEQRNLRWNGTGELTMTSLTSAGTSFLGGGNGAVSISGELSVTGGNFTLNGGGTSTIGSVFVSGGTATFGGGALTVNGSIMVSEGSMRKNGGTITANGGIQVSGGTFTMNGTAITGDITVSGDGSLTMDHGTINGDVSVSGSGANGFGASLAGGNALTITGSLTIGENAAVNVTGGSKLNVGGLLEAESGKVTISANNGHLVLQAAGENKLGTLELQNNAHLQLTFSAEGYSMLQLGALALNGHTLTLDLINLSDYVNYLETQQPSSEYRLQLFSGDRLSEIVAALQGHITAVAGYRVTLGTDGYLTINLDNLLEWSASAEDTDFTWSATTAEGTNDWSEGGTGPSATNKNVLFNNSTDSPATVTVSGSVVAGKLFFSGTGNGGILVQEGTGDRKEIHSVGAITVGTDTTFGVKACIDSNKFVVEDHTTAKFDRLGGAENTPELLLGDSGQGVELVGEGSVFELGEHGAIGWQTSGRTQSINVTGLGTFRIHFADGNQEDNFGARHLAFAEGVTLELAGNGASFSVGNVAASKLKLTGTAATLTGTNTASTLTSELTGTLTLGTGHTSTTINGTADSSIKGALSVEAGTLTIQNGKLQVEGGVSVTGSSSVSVETDLYVKEMAGGDLNTISVVGGTLTVTGSLYGVDGAEHSGQYYNHAHAGKLVVGSEDAAGTVTIGTQQAFDAAEETGDAANRPLLQVYSLDMSNSSTVTVYGNLSLGYDGTAPGGGVTSTIAGGTLDVQGDMVNQETLKVTGGTVTIGGNYSGDATSLNGGGSIELNGADVTMTVNGTLNIHDDPNNDVNGAITVKGGAQLTAMGGLHGNEGSNAKYFSKAHAGALTVGDATTTGTLIVGDEGTHSNVLLQVRSIALTGSESSITVYGDVSFGWQSGVTSSVNGGTLTATGKMVNEQAFTVSEGGTVEVGGSYSGSAVLTEDGALVVGGAITLATGGQMTVKGGMNASSGTVGGKKGEQSSTLTLGETGEIENTIGTLTVNTDGVVSLKDTASLTVTELSGNGGSIEGGTLNLTTAKSGSFGGTISSNLTYAGGSSASYTLGSFSGNVLTVAQGQLTVNTLSGNLESLTMGNQAKLTVQSGNLSITGTWNWGEGSTLALRGENAQITLGGGIQLPGGGNKLTIDLSEALLGGNGGRSAGEYQLFTGDGLSRLPEDWADNFAFTVGEREVGESYYNGLALDGTGLLTWDDAVGSNNMYWGANASDAEVVLGASEEGEWSAEQGVAGTEAWANNKNIFLQRNEVGNVSVTVVNGAKMRTLNISGSATYVMEAGGEGSVTVTVNSTFTNHATVSVEENVTVNAEGGYTGTGTLKLAGGNVSVRTVSTVNRADVTAGTLTLAAGSTITELTGTPGEGQGALVTSEGALTVGQGSYGGALSVAGDLTVTGNFAYSGQNGNAGALNVGGALNLVGSLTVTDLKGSGAITGSGTLNFAGGPGIAGNNFKGSLSVGTLKLSSGTLALNSGTLTANSVEAAGGGLAISMTGGVSLDFGQLTLSEGGKLSITLNDYDAWAKDHESDLTYQLFSSGRFAGLWNALKGDQTEENWWEAYFEFHLDSSDKRTRVDLNADGTLTFEIEKPEGTVWTGGGEGEDAGVWSTPTDPESSDPDGNWGEGNKAPGADSIVTFKDLNEGGGTSGNSEVKLDGGVQASEVYVDSGSFTFTSKEGEGGSLTTDKLTVGGKGEEASLELDASLGGEGTVVDLREQGSLTVGENGSLGENAKVQFNGGTLNLTSDSSTDDIASKVDAENSSDKVKVKVESEVTGKSWNSDDELSGGVKLALEKGIEKSGEGDFTLSWQDDGTDGHGGNITVENGTLTLDVKGKGDAAPGSAQMTGDVTGSGTLKAGAGKVTLSGDVSQFGGTLNTGDGEGGGITLAGDAASGTVSANVSGSNTLDVESSSGVTLTGDLGTAERDNLTVKNSGAGDLTIAGSVGSNTQLNTDNDNQGDIVLGNESQSVDMSSYNGTVAGSGDLVLANVGLSKDFDKDSANLYVDTALAAAGESDQPASYARRRARRAARGAESGYAGGIVDMGGMDVTNKLSGIRVNADGLLTGVTGSYATNGTHNLTLHFTSSNWGEDAGSAKNALIQGSEDGGGFTLDTSSNENVNFEFDVDIFKAFATGDPNETKEIWLHLADNTNWKWSEEQQGEQAKDWWNHFLFGTVKGVTYEKGGDGGVYVRLSGTAEDLYIVMGGDGGDGATSDRADQLSGKKATVLLDGQTLTLNWAGNNGGDDAVVHNLLGAEGTALSITDTSGTGNRLNVSLDNTLAEDIYDSRRPESDLPKPEGSTVHGQHTTFLGSITGEAGVDITKVGKGTLTVGGDYRLTDGTTTITEGALKLRGADNRMKGLVFAYGTEDPDKNNGEDARGLLLEGGKTTVTGSIKEGGEEGIKKGNINLSKGAELELNGQSELEGTSFTGDGTGTITLKTGVGEGDEEGASLRLGDAASISGVGVNLAGKDTVLDVGETTGSTLSALNGTGTVTIGSGGALTVESGAFSGTLGVDGTENATFAVAADKSFTFDNITTTASGEDTGKVDIQLGDNATLRMDLTKTGSGDDETIQFGDIDVGNGRMILDTGAQNTANVAGELLFGEQGMLVLNSSSAQEGDFTTKLTSHSMTPEALREHVQLRGVGFLLSEVSSIGTDEKGYLTVQTREATQNKFERALPGSTKNPLAGAQMVWDSLRSIQQWEAFINALCHPNSDYDRIILDLTNKLDSGQTGELERSLAAIAGSSLSTLGPAFSEDLHRQLKTIRNRTTSMDASAAEVQGEEPMHMWISGEGGYHKLEADGYFSGYTLNSWGGSLGMNVDVSKKTTLGLAITAMYGDLKTESADVGRGNLDTMYLSGFMRTASGAWLHTLAITGGVADVQMNRTVNYGSGSYATQGSTDGYALGALYEIGYTRLLNAEGTVALQPVMNVEFRHVGIKGYTETGSNAALRVDDIEQNILSVGAGARLQSIVGENAFNRASIFEARVLLKAEVGDRSGTTRNGFVGTTRMSDVESAEVGSVGVEAGAGLTIPVGTGGSLFMDAALEYRRGWMSADASVGYRIHF